MPSNINPTLTPTKSLSNFRFWCQKVLPLVYDDSLSYYEVLGKMVVQLNDVIDDVNADIENVDTLKEAFLALQTYVNEFFADIDQLASYAERAEAAQTAANQSAINASESATNASASSLAAMNARDAAVTARQAAETSANTASTAATNANTKASEAAQSAITAQTAQASASQSATLAATDRSAAQTAANTATSKASEASTSAENAAQSEANAEELVNTVQESLTNIQKNTQDIVELKETDSYTNNIISGLEYPFDIDGNINATGGVNTGTTGSYKCTDFIFVGEGSTLFAIDIISRDWAPAYTWYDYNKEKISNSGVSNGTYLITEMPENAVYVRFSSNVENDNNPRIFSCSQKAIETQIINKTSISNNISTRGTQGNNRAPKNLYANDFVIIGATLYKVTQNVAQGLNLAEGTNIRKTSIGEELTALINA